MDDAVGVGFLQRLRDLLGDLPCILEKDRSPAEPILEVLGDVRVVQRGEEPGLTAEA